MIVNGEKVFIDKEISILSLLNQLKYDTKKVVVEVDKQIIKKDDYVDFLLKNSNIVEVISFVGGG